MAIVLRNIPRYYFTGNAHLERELDGNAERQALPPTTRIYMREADVVQFFKELQTARSEVAAALMRFGNKLDT